MEQGGHLQSRQCKPGQVCSRETNLQQSRDSSCSVRALKKMQDLVELQEVAGVADRLVV